MEDVKKNPFDLFAVNQETFEDANQKYADESIKSFQKIPYFKMDKPGKYVVRILPIAPTIDAEGNATLDRKGYEYPTKSQILRLENPSSKSKKNAELYVPVTHSSYVGIKEDLIDTYISVAEDLYGDDEALVKKVKGSGFEGGLKWNNQRCMYVLDMDNRSEGIQMLSLSYSQYRELEERKLDIWKKLMKKNPKCLCPISSITNAYPVEITRKEEKKKVSYLFNVDALSEEDELSEEELQKLLDFPRLPETLYRYSRYHLEATIEFLKQYDAKMSMEVMKDERIATAIEQIKLELPADDKSHFSFDKKDADSKEAEDKEVTIDSLWDTWEKLDEQGIGDKTDEGQELRDAIREFIDDNKLTIRNLRKKTNEELLVAIEAAMGNDEEEDPEEENETKETVDSKEEPQEEAENDSEEEPEEPEAEEEPEAPVRSHRGEHNDDTNEPAQSPAPRERRHARPERRKR